MSTEQPEQEQSTGPYWQAAQVPGARKEYLLGAKMSDWQQENLQAAIQKELTRIAELEKWQRISPEDASREKAFWDKPPYFNPFIQQIHNTAKYVLGAETNFQSSLWVDATKPFDDIESAKRAAEALPDYYASLEEPNNTMPKYSPDKGWYLPEK